jgi:protein-tyrosine phosphatase
MSVSLTTNSQISTAFRYYFDILVIILLETLRIFTLKSVTKQCEMATTTLAVVGTQLKSASRPINIFHERRRLAKVTLSQNETECTKQGISVVKHCNRIAVKREGHMFEEICDSEGYRGPKSPSIESGLLDTKTQYKLCLNVSTVESNQAIPSCELNMEPTRKTVAAKIPAMDVSSEKESIASISSSSLAELLEKKPSELLVIDCRNFMEYNSNHISDAVNVCCTNRITRKRLVDGKVTIHDLVSGSEDAKKLYQERETGNATIVVYDVNSSEVESLTDAHSLKLLANKLNSQKKDVRFLLGGIGEFQKSYPHLCTQPESIPQPPLLFSPTSPYVDAAIDTAVISEILPYLYLGNERDAANLQQLTEFGITHILNVTAHIPLHFEDNGILCKRLPASDSGSQNLKQYFDEAISFIEAARSSNGRVLVHCQAGVSRSPTITIAYIMALLGKSSNDAFEFVNNKRNIVSPNLNFMGQLFEFEQRSQYCGLTVPPALLVSG